MMTPIDRGGKGYKSNRRAPKLLLSWQRTLLGVYAALFGLVLPLICWGALAEPGHPHRFPHFVFAAPLGVAMSEGKAMANQPAKSATVPLDPTQHSQHRGQPGGAVKPESASPYPGLVTNGAVPGRATLALLIFSILSLVFFAAWIMRSLDLSHFAIW